MDSMEEKNIAEVEETASNAAEETSNSEEKMFSQEQVSRMMAKEKNQGRNAVFNELGINPKDKDAINAVKSFISSRDSGNNTEQIEEANNRATIAEIKAEAMMLGAGKQYVEDITTLVISKLSESTDIKTAIGELKAKYPVWFTDAENTDDAKNKGNKGKGKTGMRGTGSSISSNSGDSGNKQTSIGKRLAVNKRATTTKKTYWN